PRIPQHPASVVVSREYLYTGRLSFSEFVIVLICRVCVSCNGHHRWDGGNTTSDVAAALTLTLSLDRGCRFLNEGNCGSASGMIKWVRVRWWRWVERRTFWKATHNWGSGSRRMQAPGKLKKRRARSAS